VCSPTALSQRKQSPVLTGPRDSLDTMVPKRKVPAPIRNWTTTGCDDVNRVQLAHSSVPWQAFIVIMMNVWVSQMHFNIFTSQITINSTRKTLCLNVSCLVNWIQQLVSKCVWWRCCITNFFVLEFIYHQLIAIINNHNVSKEDLPSSSGIKSGVCVCVYGCTYSVGSSKLCYAWSVDHRNFWHLKMKENQSFEKLQFVITIINWQWIKPKQRN
jgi:hypothetical protein